MSGGGPQYQRYHGHQPLQVGHQLQVARAVRVALGLVAGPLPGAVKHQYQRQALLQGEPNQSRALGGIGVANRPALDGKVLGDHNHAVAVDAPAAADHAVAGQGRLAPRVIAAGQFAVFTKAVRIAQAGNPLPRIEAAARPLAGQPVGSPHGLGAGRAQLQIG